MAVTGCRFVALAVNHVQGRTSGFLESTGPVKLQGAEHVAAHAFNRRYFSRSSLISSRSFGTSFVATSHNTSETTISYP